MIDRAYYISVIKSPRWRALRKRLRPKDNACARCRKMGYQLEMHHKTYERLGHELDSDLEFLCPYCHPKADQERAARGKLRASRAYERARVDRWATKVYGDDWEYQYDLDTVVDQFDQWLEARGDRE